ncbi:MBL fold metallo-hydrolase RNA specificity domain-containing protein [Alitiscatomonas aceti]|jgi:predicted exonuclease of the beta-lactamase fold involved in RNA processing|uniref:MBL fold metallo-hydrolase n=1 Tax=Alitiscatomonas aceti TaxID=2981724 RepID=A0ABT2V394_9FIRM|nr:MBL fold metallo-hydrolase [Alitiscatomonas aceti]MCU6801353.1 MBL fold metallo-hydrolase [Alitiscatomonas aceti]
MKLTFIGANHEVTGSCHCLEACGKKILVDYGMEQGGNVYENAELPFAIPDVDYILITHAHIDHTGLLPLLYAEGFRGQIFATQATCDLCNIMLKDSAHIQEMEAEWKNRKARRAGKQEVEPLYTINDAQGVLTHFVPCHYKDVLTLTDGLRIRFTDVGHLLGSASIEVWMEEEGVEKKIVFSGDIGNKNKPLIKNPSYIDEADYVVMECTYGDRTHDRTHEHIEELAQILQETLDRGGNLVIPAFAVGRTQEILYFMRKIKEEKLIKGHDDFEVYVDSPLAVEATQVFTKNIMECYDEEAMDLVNRGINPIGFPGLKLSITSEDSKNINFDMTPKVIISAAGMCDAGRIRHHLKHNLWRPECTILFAGYQAVGTLGRSLLEGAQVVKLFGETIDVEAHIEKLDGISGHADMNGLITWVSAFKEKPSQVFLVHGDDDVCTSFAGLLHTDYGFETAAPFSGSVYDLAAGAWLKQTVGVPLRRETERQKENRTIFELLVAAGERLMRVIRKNRECANKDIKKFTADVNALCDKWDL